MISNYGAITENIFAFLDHHSKEMLPIRSYIFEDNRDFSCCLQNLGVPEKAILVSFDMVGLYPYIS